MPKTKSKFGFKEMKFLVFFGILWFINIYRLKQDIRYMFPIAGPNGLKFVVNTHAVTWA